MGAPFRFPRAAAFTAAMFSLATGAHVLAGGVMPQPGIAAGLIALVLMPVMMLARIRVNAPVMAILLTGGQLVLHEAFSALSVSTAFASRAGEHLHPAGPVAAVTAGGVGGEHLHASDPLMLALHGLATIATALVLARGEAAVWALAAWLRPLVRILAAVFVPHWPQLPAPRFPFVTARWRRLRLPALRGPPCAPAVP
ncbi:hypothetical protein NG819_07585 [Pseudarthrobacter sp. Fe7]|nr:hypothetical protein NG819_07585 [Pseudarthrobacter sp. Fe7]